MIRCRKELKDGETLTEAQDEKAGGSAELQEARKKLVDASSFFLHSYLLIDNFVVGVSFFIISTNRFITWLYEGNKEIE